MGKAVKVTWLDSHGKTVDDNVWLESMERYCNEQWTARYAEAPTLEVTVEAECDATPS